MELRDDAACDAKKATPTQKQLNSQLCKASSPREVGSLVRQQVGIMNSVNCATALHKLSKIAGNKPAEAGPSADHEMHRLLGARVAVVLEDEANGVTPRSLTSIVWAMGKLRLGEPRLVAAMAAQVRA